MTEDQLQQKCVMWFDQQFPEHRQMLFSVPNGGERNDAAARLMKATGVKRGVADLILVLYMETVFIELKVGDNDLSEDQEKFRDRVTTRGHSYFVVRDTLLEFQTLINKLLL